MECPTLGEIKFSKESIEAIEEIRKIKIASKNLIKAIGYGHITNILLSNDALQAQYSLYSTDFEKMSKAMASVPAIAKKRIADISGIAYMTVLDHKERRFWKAIYSGCSIK